MQDTSHTIRNLVIAVVIIAAVVFAGYYYATRDTTPDATLLVGAPTASASGVEGDLLSALQQLRHISLDTSIFQNPVFQSFIDYSTTLVPQAAGRPNPFAPLDASALAIGAQVQLPASLGPIPAPLATTTATTTGQ